MVLFRRRPDEVFTPRSPIVNPQMYVDRSDLERRLAELVSGSKHIVVHGESGNGKSWLYKKVFEENKVPYVVVNLANALRFDGIALAMKDKLDKARGDDQALSQVVVVTNGTFTPGGVGVSLNTQKVYDVVDKDPLQALMMLESGPINLLERRLLA